MKFDWSQFKGKSVHVTMFENYGLVTDSFSNTPVYEIVFKWGSLKIHMKMVCCLKTREKMARQ
ncbi:hypothetical protein MASR1M107_17980 [Ignavibacteriales bacterium]